MTRRRTAPAVVAAAFAIALTSFASLAASTFEGVWKVQDSSGQPFEITLSADGAAKATRGPGMVGTWKEAGKTAVINWSTGWTTTIAKMDGHYKHSAYRKGQSPEGAPTSSSDAQKVQ